jgi:hypothetical protein
MHVRNQPERLSAITGMRNSALTTAVIGVRDR